MLLVLDQMMVRGRYLYYVHGRRRRLTDWSGGAEIKRRRQYGLRTSSLKNTRGLDLRSRRINAVPEKEMVVGTWSDQPEVRPLLVPGIWIGSAKVMNHGQI